MTAIRNMRALAAAWLLFIRWQQHKWLPIIATERCDDYPKDLLQCPVLYGLPGHGHLCHTGKTGYHVLLPLVQTATIAAATPTATTTTPASVTATAAAAGAAIATETK